MAASSADMPTVLVTRLSALGDVAMSVPVLYDACRAYPGVRFVMITKKGPAQIFVNRPANLVVEGVDFDNSYRGLAGVARLFRHLRRTYRPEALIDLHDVTRTKVMRLMAHIYGMRVGHIDKGRAERRNAIKHAPGEGGRKELRSSFERYRQVFAQAGYPFEQRFTTIFDGASGPEADISAITAPKLPGETWLAVAPFAAHPGKVYPADQMAEVIRGLAADSNRRIFVFGAGAAESEAIDRMTAGLPNVVSMARIRAGIACELELMRHIDAAVTMDSANMHLASLVGVPVVSIWGATHPACGFYGWRQRRENALGADMPCRPCSIFGNDPCRRGDYPCLRAITPDQVIKHTELLLKK